MLWAARRRMGILRPGVDSHARNDHPHRHQRTFETRQHSEGNAIQSRVSASHPVCKEGPVPPIRSARGRPIPTALRYDGSGWPEVERSLTWLFYRRGLIWYADFYADGKRVQESTGTANRREAEKFVALRLSEAQRGVYVKPVHVPLPELWERYIAYSKAHKRSWKRDDQMYRNLQGFFGPVNLHPPAGRGLPAAPRPGSLAGNRQS